MDVVKTRLMNQAGGRTDVHHYKGVIDCFINMPKQEGIGPCNREPERPAPERFTPTA